MFHAKPAFCPEYSKTENFIGDMKAILLDLKAHYGADLLTPNTGGYEFVSHLIFHKLSGEIQNSFINKLHKNYPTFDDIYDNHLEVIANLNRTRKKKVENKDNNSGARTKINFTTPTG